VTNPPAHHPADRGRAIVVGGSIGGLTTALLLRERGFRVDLFERSAAVLDGLGSGIVLQPDTLRWITERHGELDVERVSTGSSVLRYIGAGNEVVHEEPTSWRFTSWTTLYRTLLGDFGTSGYHMGESAVGVDQDGDRVELRFLSGRREQADLVVFADGISSTGRRRLLPGLRPTYSGYVGWRGTVPESYASAETRALLDDALSYTVVDHSHVCMYPIPGPDGELTKGQRLLNFVWYRNVPEGPDLDELMTDTRGNRSAVSVRAGSVQARYLETLPDEAARELSPVAAELVARTEHPYIQCVIDNAPTQMAFGRVAILGDAAFTARPHAAAGTAKAAADAWALADALAEHDDVEKALAAWEPAQLALGEQLVRRSAAMGDRAQHLGTWDPADPALHFGLYGPDR
jgi:2,6-dihydroxypyridine 3-monooxygenase